MRMVSWIVVLGALAWLLYAQLKINLPEEALADIPDETVSGTINGAFAPQALPTALDGSPDGPVAVLAYRDIYPMIEAIDTVAALDRIDATSIVRSRNRAVDPADILLFLDDGDQLHQFPVGQYGEVNLPARADWRDAGYLLRSNQPEGSLDLQVTFIMRALPGPRVEYAWLWESVAQMGTAMAAMQAAGVAPPGEVVGVIFEFEPGERGTLQAGEGAERAVLTADEKGFLRLEMTADLLADNPTLAFSPMPERMVPLLAPPESADEGVDNAGAEGAP